MRWIDGKGGGAMTRGRKRRSRKWGHQAKDGAKRLGWNQVECARGEWMPWQWERRITEECVGFYCTFCPFHWWPVFLKGRDSSQTHPKAISLDAPGGHGGRLILAAIIFRNYSMKMQSSTKYYVIFYLYEYSKAPVHLFCKVSTRNVSEKVPILLSSSIAKFQQICWWVTINVYSFFIFNWSFVFHFGFHLCAVCRVKLLLHFWITL